MFGRKKDLKATIAEEISAGHAKQQRAATQATQEKQREAQAAREAFNRASQKAAPVREGLKLLERETGGKIAFTETQSGQQVVFVSNIPASGMISDSHLTVSVDQAGDITAHADAGFEYSDQVGANVSKKDAVEKVVTFVVERAIRKGISL